MVSDAAQTTVVPADQLDRKAAEFARRVKDAREDAERSIRYHEKQIELAREKLASSADNVAEFLALVEKLEAAGFSPRPACYCLYMTVETTQDQLTALYKIVGRLNTSTLTKTPVKRKRIVVACEISPVKFPNVIVKYEAKLPPNAKCKIVAVKKTSYTRELQCDV